MEAFHIESCPLTEQPVELQLFQISLFSLYRCHELTTPWLWICQRQVWQLVVGIKMMNWFFPGGTETWTDEAPLWWRWKDSLARSPPPWTETQILTGGQLNNISNAFDWHFKAITITVCVHLCPPSTLISTVGALYLGPIGDPFIPFIPPLIALSNLYHSIRSK